MKLILSLYGSKTSSKEINNIIEEAIWFLRAVKLMSEDDLPITQITSKYPWLKFLAYYINKGPLPEVATKDIFERIKLSYREEDEDIRSEMFVQCLEWMTKVKAKKIKTTIPQYLRRVLPYTLATYLTGFKPHGYMRPYRDDKKPIRRISELKQTDDIRFDTIIFNVEIGGLSRVKASAIAGVTDRTYRNMRKRQEEKDGTKEKHR